MIAVVQYNAGNIRSVQNALQRLGRPCTVTDIPAEIERASHVIFPGVGEAGSAMKYLKDKGLDAVLRGLQQPVLGVCLGLQLLCRHSEESDTDCLGIFDAEVKKFPPQDKVPHMGWNNCGSVSGKLFQGITPQHDFYFVHGYYAGLCEHTTAVSDYILPFSAALEKDNFFAVQFHPEKSADAGETILKNFLAL